MIILKISCSFPINTLIPLPTAAISLLNGTVTRLVRSPSRLSISPIMPLISFRVLSSGRITSINTLTSATANATILVMIVAVLVTTALS